MSDKIEPCEFCGTKWTKERQKIADKYIGNDDPCYCESIKKIEKLSKKLKKLKESNMDYLSYLMDRDDALYDFEENKKEVKQNDN